MEILIGLTIPFLGTFIGAALVFMLRDRISDKTNRAMLGFASGVMVAASFWSLLQPALEQSGTERRRDCQCMARFRRLHRRNLVPATAGHCNTTPACR